MSLETISKNDFLFFQNDILKDIKSLEYTMNNKITQLNQAIITKTKGHDSILSKLAENINELIAKNASQSQGFDHLEELLRWKGKVSDSLIDFKTQINLVNRSLTNSISRYDSIIIENLSLPGIIGITCKFKNFKDYFEFIYAELKANNAFKEQQIVSMKKLREEIKSFMRKEESDIFDVKTKTNSLCNSKFKEFDRNIEDKFNAIQELVQAVRLENSKSAMDLIEKTQELQTYIDQIKEIKKEIHDENEKELAKFRKEVENNTVLFMKNQNDFKLFKQKFTQLSEYIKDIRFQRNIKYAKIDKMAKNIDFTKKQKYKDDYDMELYQEITKDLMGYLNSNEKGTLDENNSNIINQENKEQIKNNIARKFRNSTKINIENLNKINMNKVSPVKQKRNSMFIRQNEFSQMKKKIYGIASPIKEEETLRKRKNSGFILNDLIEKNNKDKISFSKSKKNYSSSSSSPSSSSSSLYSSYTIKSKEKNKEKEKEKEKNKEKEKKSPIKKNKKEKIDTTDKKEIKEIKTIKTSPKKEKNITNINNIINKNKTLTETEQKIKEIKEEYGNKAKLISMDLMASTNKAKYSNKDILPLFDTFSNNKLKLSDNQKRQSINIASHPKNKIQRNYYSNKNLIINTESNLILNRNINNNILNYNNNKIRNNNLVFPNIINTDKKKGNEKILLFKSKNNINTEKNNTILIDLKNKTQNNLNIEKSITNLQINPISDNNKSKLQIEEETYKGTPKIDNTIQNDEHKKTENIQKINNINIDLNNKKDIKNIKKLYNNLDVQNVTKFNIEKTRLTRNNIKEESIKETETKNLDNNDSILNQSYFEREFEKEINVRNIIIIKEKINKINNDNEELSSKINSLEDKFTPMIGQINDIVKIISLIYDTIKKGNNNNKTFTIIHSTTNNINNKLDITPLKTENNIRNDILKEYKTKKGISLRYPFKKENLNNSFKKSSREENYYNIEEESSEFNKIFKDDLNLLLSKIEPFLISKFKKNQNED